MSNVAFFTVGKIMPNSCFPQLLVPNLINFQCNLEQTNFLMTHTIELKYYNEKLQVALKSIKEVYLLSEQKGLTVLPEKKKVA
jgi:hypothetical protein